MIVCDGDPQENWSKLVDSAVVIVSTRTIELLLSAAVGKYLAFFKPFFLSESESGFDRFQFGFFVDFFFHLRVFLGGLSALDIDSFRFGFFVRFGFGSGVMLFLVVSSSLDINSFRSSFLVNFDLVLD
jgi:hypothetical protein